MPIYVFECSLCRHTTEVMAPNYKEVPVMSGCPKCERGSMVKVPAVSNAHYRGMGWGGDKK